MMYAIDEIIWAAQLASIVEVCSKKPGNVHINRSFHDTNPFDFFAGAVALGSAFQELDRLSVGEIVLESIKARAKLTSANVNLGIILLLAPLSKAALCCDNDSDTEAIRNSLRGVLGSLSESDAVKTYEAIRMSGAGGMGRVDLYDVNEMPQGITLREAMAAASDRDSIAREYVTDFSITFELSLPSFADALERGLRLRDAAVQAFLTILSKVPDTLIFRKLGWEEAVEISGKAFEVLERGGVMTERGRKSIHNFDNFLRKKGNKRNPGTTADLVVSGIFLYFLDAIHRGLMRDLVTRW
ncbi:triphosphoribosyl-dephospho-CoA synthase [Acetomicrobium hydrogeniformans]|uniref:Triphosphoribosyl-dephospho-CoA synthase n=1 Tax=Acetomicrobium hydrogeniformans ATCC BAA-1850 TaxID=592015 RepID=A0A0T5X9D7_9BACT|nr:triphosphoribosyl-dephospho-CoA synthase [Acetomicrobium hydrogeniformans]KRT34991.1 triphosphoribosyl-dephospho-CoA synthase [Acetomicrobium hydrogeniformans ATCC BAA-1850]